MAVAHVRWLANHHLDAVTRGSSSIRSHLATQSARELIVSACRELCAADMAEGCNCVMEN